MTVDSIRGAVLRAEARIRPYVETTPLFEDERLSGRIHGHVYLKLENLQRTGSFKARGALSRLAVLTDEERRRGVIAASTGNHGAAVAYGMSVLGIPGLIVVPDGTTETKRGAIGRFGVEILSHGTDCVESEVYARRLAEESGCVFVSPYNDPEVIAGQGTLSLEIDQAIGRPDALFVSLGGGGLTSGAGGYFYGGRPPVAVVACSPAHSPVMAESLRAGRILEMETQPTLSDGTAGGVEPGAITFGLCASLIDRHVLVSEKEIRAAMDDQRIRNQQVVEGAAGVALAGFEKVADNFTGQTVVVVVCGGNVGV